MEPSGDDEQASESHADLSPSPPPNFRPPFPPTGGAMAPFPPGGGPPVPPPGMSARGPPPAFVAPHAGQPPSLSGPPSASFSAPVTPGVLPPANGVFWPDNDASPAEKRALEPQYRYTSPGPEESSSTPAVGQKRKAAADFL